MTDHHLRDFDDVMPSVLRPFYKEKAGGPQDRARTGGFVLENGYSRTIRAKEAFSKMSIII